MRKGAYSTLDILDSRITNGLVLKPQDLLVTLKLASILSGQPITFATLAASLSMSASEVFAATKRAAICHLLTERATSTSGLARYRPAALNLREFLVSGLRYVFPAEPGKAARGFRTAQDAPPLAAQFVRSAGDLRRSTRGMAPSGWRRARTEHQADLSERTGRRPA
jgi:hypothetical protein